MSLPSTSQSLERVSIHSKSSSVITTPFQTSTMIQATGTVNSASVVVSMSTLSVDSYSIATQTLQSNVFASSIQPTATLIAQDPFITSLPTATPTQNQSSCPPSQDVWGIEWPRTERNMSSVSSCFQQSGGLSSITGHAKRYCSLNGEWERPNLSGCQNKEYADILSQVSAFDSNFTESELVGEVTRVVSQLAALSISTNSPLLPSSLDAANQVLNSALYVLENGQNVSLEIIEFLADVLDQLLDAKNGKGWMALQSDEGIAGSTILLNTAERVGELLARAQGNSGLDKPIQILRPNIALSAKEYKDSANVDSENLSFPNSLSSVVLVRQAQIQLPPSLLRKRLSQLKLGAVPVVFMLIQNIALFLPSTAPGLDNVQGASALLSAQVGPRKNKQPSLVLQTSPVVLKFNIDNTMKNISRLHCVFWNFSNPVGNGNWSTDGLETVHVITEESHTSVQCTSTHLTSFAVLVSVGGVGQNAALLIISYIGCSISILCLLLTIIFFLTHWRELLTTKVHYFVHLNFALSLFLAYIVFTIGIETARGSKGGCAFVAALLHYLFLAAFCWMLCEGVMIYLLLVLVFTQLKNKWWFFLLLGYLPPLLIVVISVSARWDDYGVKDDEGNIQFCWLSTNNGTIAAFVAPMLLIILINVVFMALAFRVIWKTKKSILRKVSTKDKDSSLELVKSLLTAAVVLLPILGLTWVFGVLAVNENTELFAWIFTILNSFQGVFIFIFHVIKTEKVQQKIKTLLHIRTASGSASFGHRYTSDQNAIDSGTLKSTLSSTGTIQKNLGSRDFEMSNGYDGYGFEEKSVGSLTS